MAEEIGKAKCPLCSSPRATVKLSTRGLACLTCLGCSCQIFARSERSDEALRACIVGAKPAAAAAAPAAPEVKDGVREGEPAPVPAASKGKAKASWDPWA